MIDYQDKVVLCQVSALQDPGSQGMRLELPDGCLELFLVRRGNAVYGYRNRCPHTGVNLDWLPDQFLDSMESFIQCATHGALFRIEDGYCLSGPCAGEHLQKLPVTVERGEVMLLANTK